MAAAQTADQFVNLLRKSQLVDEKRLDAFLHDLPLPRPSKPRALAELCLRRGLLTPFQATQLLAGKWRGFLVAGGKYKLFELLGAGGMGKVYLCEHRRMKRLVALKVLPTDKLEDPSSLERFDREARASAALDHPNIVRAHDVDQDGNLHFLVMEYVDGSSLQDIVKKFGPMDVTRACHYIAQTAEGMQHAHEIGWVHRDIKPSNLLLDRTGTIKLLDMGLARFFHDDGRDPLTSKYDANAVLGTADYLAPEQVDSSHVTIRADIYSLGGTFYFLLTGQAPFEHGSVQEKLVWHQTRLPESIRERRPDVPKELEAVINQMMAKLPEQRYQEPWEVVEALEPWTAQPIEPPPAAEMPRRCPALEKHSTALVPAPSSGSLTGSGVRRPVRNGPRSGSQDRLATRMARIRLTRGRWIGLVCAVAVVVFSLIGVIYWITHPTEPGKTGPIRPSGIQSKIPPEAPPDEPKNLPQPPQTSDR
jgi:serine/threonine protein kinase